jgi:hypothetical protein
MPVNWRSILDGADEAPALGVNVWKYVIAETPGC